jgi:hypothetical protein
VLSLLDRVAHLSAGDSRLARLREKNESERDQAIAELIAGMALPQAERLVRSAVRSGSEALTPEDAEDILATVSLRLLTKLRAIVASADEPIERLEEYVTTLTFNAINDHFRRRFPQRTRLKNRLRYTLTRDARLALWTAGTQLVCGLSRWRGQTAATQTPASPDEVTERRLRDRSRPAEALIAYFKHCGAPRPFETVVDLMSVLWHVTDAPPPVAAPAVHSAAETPSESRRLLADLWREIVQLPPMQRKALLLNLRNAETSHALDLFVLTGIASHEAIAGALEMSRATLESVWSELPFEDTRTARLLGITRQQVINLRKSARERLTRRLSRRKVM